MQQENTVEVDICELLFFKFLRNKTIYFATLLEKQGAWHETKALKTEQKYVNASLSPSRLINGMNSVKVIEINYKKRLQF